MSRRKTANDTRIGFEALERRELMAADLMTGYRSAVLASETLDPNLAAPQAVGGSIVNIAAILASLSGNKNHLPPVNKPSTPAPPASPPTVGSTAPVSSPNDWYTANLHDLALRTLLRQDGADGVLSRQDMLGVFGQVEKDGKVSADELADLKQVVANTSFFAAADYVRVLTIDVVSGNAANAHYQGTMLGNLAAGSSATQLTKLVDKWFLGMDHPTTMSGVTYRQAAGSLFPHAPVYTDVQQGAIGDCYFLASLGEVALVNSSFITKMFIANGDGTYTVGFNHAGKLDYVTVDSMLPVNSAGNFVYANYGLNIADKNVPLWVALAEKAYVQLNEVGWLRTPANGGGLNNYNAISGGYMFEALNQITGRAGGYSTVTANNFTAALGAGKFITFGSNYMPTDPSVVGNHAYAVVSYNKTKQQVTLFNPWGINNRYAPGLVTLNWTQMKNDFFSMEYA